jgi:hypothetical protein
VDSRTRLAIGGMTTVAASIAVVCAVAMTTSAALADTAGAMVNARPVVVPSSSASPTPVPTLTAAPVTPAPTAPETVPAPEPEDVAAPPTSPLSAGEPSAEIEDALVAEVAASGSWDAVHAWAEKHGWTDARTQAWIARLDAKVTEGRADKDADKLVSPDSLTGNRIDPLLPADADETSERDRSGSSFGSKREQSRVPPD